MRVAGRELVLHPAQALGGSIFLKIYLKNAQRTGGSLDL